jgi:hypothetical protein
MDCTGHLVLSVDHWIFLLCLSCSILKTIENTLFWKLECFHTQVMGKVPASRLALFKGFNGANIIPIT